MFHVNHLSRHAVEEDVRAARPREVVRVWQPGLWLDALVVLCLGLALLVATAPAWAG